MLFFLSNRSVYFCVNIVDVSLGLPGQIKLSSWRVLFAFINLTKWWCKPFLWIKMSACQFLLGSAHILKQPLFQHACELAFSICDSDEKNYILKQEVFLHFSLYMSRGVNWAGRGPGFFPSGQPDFIDSSTYAPGSQLAFSWPLLLL